MMKGEEEEKRREGKKSKKSFSQADMQKKKDAFVPSVVKDNCIAHLYERTYPRDQDATLSFLFNHPVRTGNRLTAMMEM